MTSARDPFRFMTDRHLDWFVACGMAARDEVRRRAEALAALDRDLPDVEMVDPDYSPPDDARGL